MSLTVYGAPLSPFVRKLRVCLIEKGLEYDLQIVNPGTHTEDYLELSPLGRIPALRDGDLALADSSVICQYLEEQYAETTALYGSTVEQRARIRWLEKYADYELAPLCTFTVFRNRILHPLMGKPCDEAAIQRALEEKLPRHFDYLEKTLEGCGYFVDCAPSMADLAFATQLVNMRHGGETLDVRRWPGLSALFERILARASLQSVLPDEERMLEKLKAKAAGH